MTHLTDEQKECFAEMCERGGTNVSVLRAVAAQLADLEAEIARVAPYLASHGFPGYSFGPVRPLPGGNT